MVDPDFLRFTMQSCVKRKCENVFSLLLNDIYLSQLLKEVFQLVVLFVVSFLSSICIYSKKERDILLYIVEVYRYEGVNPREHAVENRIKRPLQAEKPVCTNDTTRGVTQSDVGIYEETCSCFRLLRISGSLGGTMVSVRKTRSRHYKCHCSWREILHRKT